MNPLTLAWRKLTYRNEYSTPRAADGLHIGGGRWGARTVRDPHLAHHLRARRVRMVQEGLDLVDLEAFLASTPVHMAILRAVADELAARSTPREAVE